MELELMENDILESLEDLGYKGPLLEDGALALAASGGATSPEYTKLCAWLVSELRLFCKLEENVQATNSPTEADEFQLEISGLLGEMNCPYTTLTSGEVTKRLLNQKNCLLLLTYLISELEAAKMLCVNAPPKKAQEGAGSEVFQELKGICIALGMSKPPANITMLQFFSGIEKKLKETLTKVPSNHVGKPLLSKPMGPVHWEKIEAINQAIANEYEVRRKLLVKRLDVTVQSFGWSDRAKSQTEKLAKVYQPKRAILSAKSAISVAHLLAARQDLSKIMRTSSGSIREKTACAINKVLMGRVPDRGGRPNEIEPPPPEMPPWQKRQDGPQQQSGGRGGRGCYESSYGGRGGYDQGSYERGSRGGYDSYGNRGSHEHGGHERGRGRGGYDHGGRGGGRGGKPQGGWTDGGGSGYQDVYRDNNYRDSGFQTGGYHGGGSGGGYQGGGYGGYQSSYSGSGYQGGSGTYQQDRYQDGHTGDRGGGRGGGRGGRGGRGNRGGQGGGWGGRGAQNINQGGQFEQHFQQGGYQYNQSGFGQGRHFTS
ncbi:protein FAM98A [Notechis scutatus]|uniref:Protein FAM98A n=1 Tax=Notechis scutatus TaxID=8663 RepID=A0A6J1V091_9SAUR|nr:protein FAM98A [Notechis scutatus]XP_026536683.1 protein FAM98A [Notechis scutatus]XP_026536692.1 protein FAM98A [Notechis scutatus]